MKNKNQIEQSTKFFTKKLIEIMKSMNQTMKEFFNIIIYFISGSLNLNITKEMKLNIIKENR